MREMYDRVRDTEIWTIKDTHRPYAIKLNVTTRSPVPMKMFESLHVPY